MKIALLKTKDLERMSAQRLAIIAIDRVVNAEVIKEVLLSAKQFDKLFSLEVYLSIYEKSRKISNFVEDSKKELL